MKILRIFTLMAQGHRRKLEHGFFHCFIAVVLYPDLSNQKDIIAIDAEFSIAAPTCSTLK